MRFQHIFHALHFEPWLITESAHATLAALLDSKLAGELFAAPGDKPATGLFGMTIPQMTVKDGIAEIPIIGPIGKGLGNLEKSCGATSVEDIQNNVSAAIGRADVKGIFLNVNSPGGTITGVPETARLIAQAKEKKPIVAFTDGMMASAAYWLGSQADMIVASESSSVGSIGVYIPWMDSSRRAEAMGIKTGVVKNSGGPFKGMGHPGTSYTEEQMAHMQERADELFGMFKGAILSQRANVKPDAMRGQVLFGGKALASGLTDEVGGYARAWGSLEALTKMKRGA